MGARRDLRFHATAAARARDAEKAAHIESLDWRVIRVTWRELRDDPGAVAARVRSAFSPEEGESADAGA
jgi:very-short-patch-repair endonuclease